MSPRAPAPRPVSDEAVTLAAVAGAQAGDRDAVRHLYRRHAQTVRRYATALLHDPDAAEDVVQATFLKVLTRIDRYERRGVPFEAWLLRVARNAALDELRRRRPVPSSPTLERHATSVSGPGERPDPLPPVLRRLPAAERDVIALRHLLGLTTEEIAERLRLEPRAVEELHGRGLRRLRTLMRCAGTRPDTSAPAVRIRRGSRRSYLEAMS